MLLQLKELARIEDSRQSKINQAVGNNWFCGSQKDNELSRESAQGWGVDPRVQAYPQGEKHLAREPFSEMNYDDFAAMIMRPIVFSQTVSHSWSAICLSRR